MTYEINGVQYWKRNGVFCSWTEQDGRKVITEDDYLNAIGRNSIVKKKPEVVKELRDPKSKVEIAYQELDKNDRIRNKRKLVTYGNLEKVIANLESKDNFVKIIATREVY